MTSPTPRALAAPVPHVPDYACRRSGQGDTPPGSPPDLNLETPDGESTREHLEGSPETYQGLTYYLDALEQNLRQVRPAELRQLLALEVSLIRTHLRRLVLVRA